MQASHCQTNFPNVYKHTESPFKEKVASFILHGIEVFYEIQKVAGNVRQSEFVNHFKG